MFSLLNRVDGWDMGACREVWVDIWNSGPVNGIELERFFIFPQIIPPKGLLNGMGKTICPYNISKPE